MKERPILFSTPMVQAILAGKKTQTRRILKTALPHDAHAFQFLGDEEWTRKRNIANTWSFFIHDGTEDSWPCNDEQKIICPYGNAGDRLWVRETFSPDGRAFYPCNRFTYKADNDIMPHDIENGQYVERFPDGKKQYYPFKWRPSIHMPREACRINLEIKRVQIEKLNDISDEDCMAEGMQKCTKDGQLHKYGRDPIPWRDWGKTPQEGFKAAWESINGPESWALNPWVWVVDFERVR